MAGRTQGAKGRGLAADETVRMSLHAVDGRRVNHAEEEALAYWAKWSPKVRALCQAGWAKIHTTSKEEDASFFASAERSVDRL